MDAQCRHTSNERKANLILLYLRPSVEDVENIEKTVNEVIARHLPVTTEFITQEEAVGRFDLKRLPTMRQIQSELYESATMTNVYVLDCTLQIPQK